MKKTAFVLFILCVQNCLAQYGTDTLYFGNKIFSLQRVKVNYNGFQPDFVQLPNEYQEIKSAVRVPYISTSDTIFAFGDDSDGNSYLVLKPTKKEFSNGHDIYLSSFLDTIKVKVEELHQLKIYIKSKGKKISFTGFKMLHNCEGILTEYESGHMTTGNLFSPFELALNVSSKKNYKKSTLLITDLYYQRGNATYYFDRNFIIMCE